MSGAVPLQLPLLPELRLGALTERAIATLRTLAPPDGSPYYGCFSGGKDSIVIKELVRLAGVPCEWHYNVTTIDPPELVRFIRREHPEVRWDRPERPFFWLMINRHGYPTRRARWCCEELKEGKQPPESRSVVGVRAEESHRRAEQWKVLTWHRRSRSWAVAPILRWTTANVWQFIREHHLPYCSLYDEGFRRLGCIGCPMAGAAGRVREFARWPGYERQWRRAFEKLWEKRAGSQAHRGGEWSGSRNFASWQDLWAWWCSDEPLPGEPSCQLDMWS